MLHSMCGISHRDGTSPLLSPASYVSNWLVKLLGTLQTAGYNSAAQLMVISIKWPQWPSYPAKLTPSPSGIDTLAINHKLKLVKA